MEGLLAEFAFSRITGWFIRRIETLTPGEHQAEEEYMAKLEVPKRKTRHPVVVALVGLVGAGKSSVAQELAREIGAIVIEGDQIRVELRKQGARYEKTRRIAENIAEKAIARGGNVIIDADFIDPKKRATIRSAVKRTRTRLIFIRVSANPDIIFGRIISAPRENRDSEFFTGAKTPYQGSKSERGVVVKLREMWRRTPHHYTWQAKGGGTWVPKKLPFDTFAEIDTTTAQWRSDVAKVAAAITKL